MTRSMLFDGWPDVARVAVLGGLAYAAMVIALRVSGKRTLAKMNAFDLIVTVALGSTLATILLSRDVSLAQGVTALGLLVALQFAITWTSVRWRAVRALATGEPVLLVRNGELLPQALVRARVTEDEVHAALRGHGVGALEGAAAVVLETDGSFSVIRREDVG